MQLLNNVLTGWRNTPTKQAILDFVAAVTTPGSPDYVPPAERIAVFDNDGTLWCEKPMYIQMDFLLRKLAAGNSNGDLEMLAVSRSPIIGPPILAGALFSPQKCRQAAFIVTTKRKHAQKRRIPTSPGIRSRRRNPAHGQEGANHHAARSLDGQDREWPRVVILAVTVAMDMMSHEGCINISHQHNGYPNTGIKKDKEKMYVTQRIQRTTRKGESAWL